MKLKLMMLGMSLGALLLSGSNLLNLMGKPSLTSEQYKLLENMCSVGDDIYFFTKLKEK
jgi:hypothetical protein